LAPQVDDELERRYVAQFKVVFDAIRQLMTPPQPKEKKIGFVKESRAIYKTFSRGNGRRALAG
jgi:hypothetical protein